MAKSTGKGAKKTPEDRADFETSMREVESIIERIESGELGLEDAISAYENGVGLLGRCRAALTAAEQRVEDLSAQIRAIESGQTPESSDDAQ